MITRPADYTIAMQEMLRQSIMWSDPEFGYSRAKRYAEDLALQSEPGRRHVDLRRVQVEEAGALLKSEPYYVAADIQLLLIEAARSLPVGSTMQEHMVPRTPGFVYLERAHSVPISWSEDGQVAHGPMHAFSFIPMPKSDYVLVNFYADNGMRWRGRPCQELVSVADWTYGLSWDHWKAGAGYISALEGPIKAMRAFVLSFFQFINQRLLVTSNRRLDRAARRRLPQMADHEPIVKVVELRARDHVSPVGDMVLDVEWSCRWIVRGHWHKYHTTDGVISKWVLPYIKGPADKPLRPSRAKVFAVVR